MPLRRLKRLVKPIVKPPFDAVRRLIRRRALSARLAHVDQASLERDLETLALPAGSIVLVHSSLKSLGFVEGGAQAVNAALVNVIVTRGGGTLAMPTFSIDGTMRTTFQSGRVFDVRHTPSNLGAIPEAFRHHPGVVRSVHPTHSIGAIGKDGARLLAGHHLAGTSFGRGTPMVRMMEDGGYLMGIGTHLGTVTFYHCLEDLVESYPLPVYSDDSPFTVRCLDWDGHEHQLTLPAHSPKLVATRIDRPESHVLRDFFTAQFERNAGLRWFKIGQSKGWLIKLQDMYDECLRLLERGITIYSTLE